MGERSSRSVDGVSLSEYCVEELRSYGEAELDKRGHLIEESVTRLFGEREPQMQLACVSASIDEVAGVSKMSHVVLSSTPVKLVDEARRVAKSMGGTLVGSTVKRISNVAVGFDEKS